MAITKSANVTARIQPEIKENAEAILQAEVGKVFEQVLCDAGVFKRDEAGKTAFLKFLQIFA